MKLVDIQPILSITSIPNADRIELARIQGWNSVIKKGDYNVGDLVIFVPIDTVIEPREWNKFLWNKNDSTKDIRVHTMRLRGTVSQGIIFPLSILSLYTDTWTKENNIDTDELARVLGISKYERPIDPKLRGEVAGSFPTFILSRTDEDNLLSNPEVLNELNSCDVVEITLKCDGTSATFIKNSENVLKVCSRNLELRDGDNIFWNVAHKYNIKELLPAGYAFQGEICGPGIQKNPLALKEHELLIFNIKNLATNSYISVTEAKENNLLHTSFKTVPIISYTNMRCRTPFTIDEFINIANAQMYKNSPAEGIVVRGYFEHNHKMQIGYSQILGKMLSFKIINQNYID